MTPLFWGHVNPYGTINSATPRTPRSKKVTQLGGGACRQPAARRPVAHRGSRLKADFSLES
jgi:hypothetical protein